MSPRGTGRASVLVDVALGVVIATGWLYVALGSPLRTPRSFGAARAPEMTVETRPDGERRARLDPVAWREAFERADLPDPPDLNGSDPIPVRILLDTLRRWNETRDVEALGRIGQIYLAFEHHAAALACFAAASEMAPGEFRWVYLFGAELQALGRSDRAIEALERARALEPDSAATYARLGSLYLDRGALDRAEEHWTTYVRLRPDQSLGYVGLGRVALARGRNAEAEQLMERAVRTTPRDFIAHRFHARALAANGKVERAREATRLSERLPQYSGWLSFDPVLQETHRFADTQRNLENEMRRTRGLGDPTAFLRAATAYLERQPSDTTILGMIGEVYTAQGRHEEARRVLDRALEIRPDTPALQTARAKLALAQKDWATAATWLDRALALDATSPVAHELRGRMFFFQNRTEEAIRALSIAISLDPTAAQSWLALASIYAQSGRKAEARRTLLELLAREPENEQARRQLASLGG